ncbi:MAG: tRNA (adenosine(37)-N6)-dimethylallyltransferase MiaA [Deltaproteobacteria bacterium]|nr:tRNA (adenosine(37)-N6)-dimethylallyltransferase MiaA [Deltaproteobacteria bacterium]
MGGDRKRIVVITGPTAAGKTALAVDLALALGGEVVNADSMQVYRHMDVGTAKPAKEEMRGVPHHLLDVVDPDQPFNAARYRELAAPAVENITGAGRACFVVGGSGLYIRALLGGLFECPEASPEVRSRLNQAWEEEGGEALHKRLGSLDPDAALGVHPNDRVRVLRALEVIELTGRPFSSLAGEHRFREDAFEALKVCLHMPRERLYERIDARSRAMMEGGLPEETRRLFEKGYSRELKPMQAIGYRHATAFLEGAWGREEAVKRLQADTRRYAKRQMTWFRGESGVLWRSPGDRDLILSEAAAFLNRHA